MILIKTATGAKRINRRIVGWREWVSLPVLGIELIKAKFDTGAKTSALHAWNQEVYVVDGRRWVRFDAHPVRKDDGTKVSCVAPLADCRWVTNSGGSRERRNVIITSLSVGNKTWNIELTLANRDQMGFRMLVGREAMRGRLIVDPKGSYRLGRRKRVKSSLNKNRQHNLGEAAK